MAFQPKLLVCVASASFLVVFDGAACQMTLPVIGRYLGGTLQEVEWTMTAFLLLSTATLLPCGRAGDVLGRERVWRAGVAVFAAASGLSAVAPSLGWLVFGRAVQGVGAAMCTANSAPILVEGYAHESGRVLGLGNVALALGMVAGPPVGALLASAFSWRWIFAVAAPLGAAIFGATARSMPASPRSSARLDVVSAFLSAVGLAGILVGATFGHRWGFVAPKTLIALFIGALGIALFVRREARAVEPILEVALVRRRVFVSGMLVSFFGFGALFVAFSVLPYLLLLAQGRSLAESGLLVGVLPLAFAVAAPLAGAWTDKAGSRLLCAGGLTVMASAFVVILTGGVRASAGRLLLALALAGGGIGAFAAPNEVEVLRSLPSQRLGAGTALLGAVRTLGMTFGTAAGGTLLDYAAALRAKAPELAMTTQPADPIAAGVGWALAAATGAALLGALSALIRRRGPDVILPHRSGIPRHAPFE